MSFETASRYGRCVGKVEILHVRRAEVGAASPATTLFAKAMARFFGDRRLNAIVDSAVFVAETTALVPGCESTVLTA
jgi:hypothetical protein